MLVAHESLDNTPQQEIFPSKLLPLVTCLEEVENSWCL